MISVEEAFDRIVGSAKPLTTEKVRCEHCSGRVLAAPIYARRSQPAADLSAMDGYAVNGTDLAAGNVLKTLNVVGESAAGSPYVGDLNKGEAVRIFTGAIVPKGADQVIIQEDVTRDGDTIQTSKPTIVGDNIRLKGIDFNEREDVLPSGTFLTPKTIGLAIAAGHDSLMVHRAPKIALLATGDELVDANAVAFSASQTVDSVRPQLTSLLSDAGANVYFSQRATDSLDEIKTTLAQCADADILLTIGGASVGDRDYVKQALSESGMSLDFWKLAMRPGKPLVHGMRGHQHVLGLPGNPVSAFVCALLFVRPLVDQLMGRPAPLPCGVMLPSAVDIPANGPRAHYMRARLIGEPGNRHVDPAASQDSSLQSVLAQCDGLLVRPVNGGAVVAGDPVPFIPF